MQLIQDEHGFTLVSHDPHTGKSVWRREEIDGGVTYRTDEPVDSLIDQNTAVRNASAGNRMGDWVKIASIPSNVLWNPETGLMDAFKQNDERWLAKWLNDGDNRAWRTFGGTV